MGNKKRNVASSSKPPQSPTAAADDGGASDLVETPNPSVEKLEKSESADSEINTSSNANPSSTYASIKLECESALDALRQGSHKKAVRLMKDLCSKHDGSEHSAFIHRVQGTVSVKAASIVDDPNAKQKLLRSAIENARKAVSLSPNSIEFAHFYANLLYEAANAGDEYEEVVEECERALLIENPVDPAEESLQDDSQQNISTAEARVANVQSELRSLIQKSNIASISTWMKNLDNVEEKFRIIPIRRVPEDPMEDRVKPARRPNEIKKVPKTPEQRRKEIQLAAGRLLQQKSESSALGNDGDSSANNNSKGVDSGSGSGQRAGERRKHASSDERRDCVQLYWNSMSLDAKKGLLRIEISDLKAHVSSLKDGLASEVLNEALSFGETNKVWKFWSCCLCNEKFADVCVFMKHVAEAHVGSLMPKLQSILPQSVEKELAEMLLNCSWKPLELNTAITTPRKHLTSEAPDFCEESHSMHGIDDSKESVGDDSKGRVVDTCDDGAEGSKDFEGVDGDQSSNKSLLNENWVLSDDPERAELLEMIQVIFQSLLRNKYLASSHLSKVIHFAVEELQSLACSSDFEKNPSCLRFLGAPGLKKILKFLQEISQSCGLSGYSDKSNAADKSSTAIRGVDIVEKITFSQDALLLVLDEVTSPCNDARECSSEATSSHVNDEGGVVLDSDALLSWILRCPSNSEQSTSWMRAKEDKAQQGLEILHSLEKEFHHLRGLCERKFKHLNCDEALQAVEDLCLEEGKINFVCRSYDSVLRERREDLIGNKNDSEVAINQFELDAITNVLKEAESPNVNQFGFEETYSSVRSHLRDLESRMKDYLHQLDTLVEVAMQRQKEHVSIEISKLDATIMQVLSGMQKLEIELDPASSHDYRSILMPLIKSFLRARLEDLAEKDTRKKSDAASEAFLAELALVTTAAVDNSSHEGSKEKKKSKEGRENKDSKAIHLDEPHGHISEEITLSDGHDEEVACSGSAKDGTDDALRLQEEEEYKHKTELEAIERKLEETFEYRLRRENAGKQKLLAEQDAREKSDAAREAFLAELAQDSKKGTTAVVDNSKHERSKKKKKSKEGRKNKDSKAIHLDEPHGLISEEILLSDGHDEEVACSESAEDATDDALRLQEEEEHKRRLEAEERKLEEMLDYQRRIENELKQKHLAEQNKKKSKMAGEKAEPSAISEVYLRCSDEEKDANEKTNRKEPLMQEGLTDILDNVPITDSASGSVMQSVSLGGNPSDGESPPPSSEKEENPSRQPKDDLKSHDDGDDGGKTLEQRQVEEEDEERFQAGLKKAVGQSLHSFDVDRKLPATPSLVLPGKEIPETGDSCVPCVVAADANEVDAYGTELKNGVEEQNRDLNVIIRALWHLRRFQNEFLLRSHSGHVHVGDPCVVCALYEIFYSMNAVTKELVPATTLRVALSNLYPDSNFFKEGQMNDASEVLGLILNCIHQSFTPGPFDRSRTHSWDCTEASCTAHSHFGMNIYQKMNCSACGLHSRYLRYTSFFHSINASAVRKMKVMLPFYSFGQLLKMVVMNYRLVCDPNDKGCGSLNYFQYILSSAPHVFTIVVGWDNARESFEDILGTVTSFSTEIDMGILFDGIDRQRKHCLASMVCYKERRCYCIAHNREIRQWVVYEDKKEMGIIGGWKDVIVSCAKGLQPRVLFFAAVN